MKTKRIITVVCLVLSLIIAGTAALAYFSDRVTSEVDKRISGTVSLTQTASSISLLNNDGQDILDPGDMRSLQFKIENTGNKSADVKTVIKIKSDKAMKSSGQAELEIYMRNDVEEIPGWGWKPKDGASPISVREMASDGKSITYSIPEYILSGNEEYGDSNREIEGSAPDEHDYPYVLLVNKDIKNAFGNTGISISIVTEAKQHRNTGPADWTTLRKDVITLTGDETSVVPRVKVKTYHITYDLGGGTLSSENPTEFSADTGLITLNNPTKEGYTFRGWTWNGQDTPVKHLSFEGADYKKDLHFVAQYGLYRMNNYKVTDLIDSTTTSVIFGKTSDYQSIVENNTPVQVGIAAEDEVYLYSVGTTKYILADEKIVFPRDSQYLFGSKSSIRTISFDNIDTSNLYNAQGLFEGCSSLRSVTGLEKFSFVDNAILYRMFRGCTSLETVSGIEHWDVSKASFLYQFFYNCNSLTSLDLSGWSISSNIPKSDMFYNCSNLKTIYVSELWNPNITSNSSSMFYGCTSLVGGAGTTYNSSYTNGAYARVDDPSNRKPGYLTYKAAP